MQNSDDLVTFLAALDKAGERPEDSAERHSKKNYAERLSNAIAVLVANKLRFSRQFKNNSDILPNSDGTGRESRSAGGRHKKPKNCSHKNSIRVSCMVIHRFCAKLVIVSHHVLRISSQSVLLLVVVSKTYRFDRYQQLKTRVVRAVSYVRLLRDRGHQRRRQFPKY